MFRFISLGSDCQTAWQIGLHKKTAVLHFFDCMRIPIESLPRLIANRFRGVLQYENLRPWYHDETLYGVIDTLYCADFAHDFGRLSRDELERVRAAYTLRARWFLELFDDGEEPVYFVRRWHPVDGDDDEPKALRLFEFLKNRRRDVRLLYLHNDPFRLPSLQDGYRSIYLKQKQPFDWHGYTPAWQFILHNFALRPSDADRDAFALPEWKAPRFG